ncbi:hypothetical protein CXF85_01955 [Colwellia sp. 75C3]|uniref:hypothetical protein n=1 Tax=Colwellia sp. 75C3 TaxID=888425 RepID=UPI000C3236F7|nr:hypothetical protein [Colwellia sp. 75C3]PKG86491.1 hypothetical protein CXF85_01955 [Colwellia sp. 75C3]
MAHFHSSIKKIIADFKKNNIDTSKPGFYDEPRFLRVEQGNPEYLNNYARFVQERNYSDEYLDEARKVIPLIVEELHKELLRDGRQGACVDLSMVLSRILEKEGFWNYIVKGSLTVSFPKQSGIGDRFFWSMDQGDFSAGHAWVVAPPFGIIDLTIKQQERDSDESQYIPELIISEVLEADKAKVEDIISPEVRLYLQAQGLNSSNMISKVNPVLEKVLETFKTGNVKFNGTQFKYIPVAIGAPDCPLENMVGISVDGMSAIKMYTDIVKPKLELEKAEQAIKQDKNG